MKCPAKDVGQQQNFNEVFALAKKHKMEFAAHELNQLPKFFRFALKI